MFFAMLYKILFALCSIFRGLEKNDVIGTRKKFAESPAILSAALLINQTYDGYLQACQQSSELKQT